MSNSEKIKPVALAVIKLCLSEGISHLLSQSATKKFCLIFFANNTIPVSLPIQKSK